MCVCACACVLCKQAQITGAAEDSSKRRVPTAAEDSSKTEDANSWCQYVGTVQSRDGAKSAPKKLAWLNRLLEIGMSKPAP